MTTVADMVTDIVPLDKDHLKLSKGSGVKVRWLCPKGHEFVRTPNSMFRSKGCPVCSGVVPIPGVNTLAALRPDIAKEWSDANDKTADQVTLGSRYRALWVCPRGHEYHSLVYNRVGNESGCPKCSGREPIVGVNDLETLFPEIAKQLVNGDPKTLKPHSNRRFLWKCSRGHQRERAVATVVKGDGCPNCNNRVLTVGESDLLTTNPGLSSQIVTGDPSKVSPFSKDVFEWKCPNGHVWSARVAHRSAGSGCPKCARQVSKPEKELADVLKSLGFIVEGSKRGVLSSRHEVDIYLPEHKLGIEFNGVYWHSSKFRDKSLHSDKYDMAQRASTTLLQFWDTQWRDTPDIVINLIKSVAGGRKSIGARETKVKPLSYSESSSFLDMWHIQGPANGSEYLGLFRGDSLVAVGVFKKRSESEAELVRYASSVGVMGGMMKLVKHSQFDSFVSFADKMVSSGNMYEKSGWVHDGEIPPDYKYLYKGELWHKFNFRKTRFRSDPDLKFDPFMTERELAEMNDLHRVYDAGKIRYRYKKG